MAAPNDKINGQQEQQRSDDETIGERERRADDTDYDDRPTGAGPHVDNDNDHDNHDYYEGMTDLDKLAADMDKMEMLLQAQLEDDEGCVVDMTEARTYGRYPLTEDRLPPPPAPNKRFPNHGGIADDSGFSSRMSEDSASLHRAVEVSELTKAVAGVVANGAQVSAAADGIAATADEQDDKREGECCKASAVGKAVVKLVAVLLLLYVFICSLDLLSNAFRLLGGKTAGSVFKDSEMLENPITGLMIGVLATVILQSSSTSTSIVITMVSSGILEVRPAIPIVMGANIGTTVTNTLVSLAHSMDPKEFRRAFSGATVHDCFNWLTVLILLPIEHFTGYLYLLTSEIVQSLDLEGLKTRKQDLLKQLTKPLTKRIVQVDKKVITAIAEGKGDPDARLLKVYCVFNTTEVVREVNTTLDDGNVTLVNQTFTLKTPLEECDSLLSKLNMSDSTSGILLFLFSLLLLSGCLYLMVKVLHSLLGSQVARMAKKTINANFPGPFACLTDYFALVVGAGMTILVQSSSVFTSALTPLVGVGCLKLERMYPLTLGSNIGTTGTGILAALAASSSTMALALQLALCHLFFNITGILLFFPIPVTRKVPLRAARFLGRTTAKYRWFAVFYLLLMYLVFPGCFMMLSLAGDVVFIVVVSVVGVLAASVFVVSVMQRYRRLRACLPLVLRSWEWLPLPLRSLQPLDSVFRAMCAPFRRVCCQCCVARCHCLAEGADGAVVDVDIDSSDDDDDDSDDDESDHDGGEDSGVSCCCPPRRKKGMKPVCQSDGPAAQEMEEGGGRMAVVWQQDRTQTSNPNNPCSPIYRPTPKKSSGFHHSSSTVPLIRIPESVV